VGIDKIEGGTLNMSDKKIVASIEARTTSSRLPGKVLMKAINGMSMLEFMIHRVKKSQLIDQIIVATTINSTDDPIIKMCKKLSINYYRGSEDDVLLRVLNAHKLVNSKIIVELTGDNPLIDPKIIDQIIDVYLNNNFDYVSNSHVRSFPIGVDTQVFSVDILKEISTKTKEPYDRENVSSYIYRSGEYSLKAIIADKELFWPELRLTLDYKGDYYLIKKIIKYFYPNKKFDFFTKDIVNYLKRNIQLLELNKDKGITIAPYQRKAKLGENG